MHYVRTPSCKGFLFLILFFFFISCGSVHSLKKTAGNKEDNTSVQMKMSQLDAELLTVKQDLATLKVQMEKKDISVQALYDDVLILKQKISTLEKNDTDPNTPPVKIEDTTPETLYKNARNLLIGEKYQNAATLFTEFCKKYPQNSLADNAVYWLGECYYSMGEYKKAILIFKDLIHDYPKSEKVPDAILKTGYSYLSLDDSNRAHHFLKQVLKEYPFSSAAEKAQEKLGVFE